MFRLSNANDVITSKTKGCSFCKQVDIVYALLKYKHN